MSISRAKGLIVRFTKEYLLTVVLFFPGPNFKIVIIPAQVVWSLQPVPYRIPCLFSGVRFEDGMNVSCLSETESFAYFANLAAFFCTQPNAFILPSLHGSQHETPYSSIGRTNDM